MIKCDNGSGFRDAKVKAWARDHGIALLYSPPGWPAYNGSCEVTCRWVKGTAEEIALVWGVDLDDALPLAARARNGQRRARARPIRICARAPDRRAFLARVARFEREIRGARGIDAHRVLRHATQADLDRRAIHHALVGVGLMSVDG